MITRVERCGMEYDPQKLITLNVLVNAPELDYYKIVAEVESIL